MCSMPKVRVETERDNILPGQTAAPFSKLGSINLSYFKCINFNVSAFNVELITLVRAFGVWLLNFHHAC